MKQYLFILLFAGSTVLGIQGALAQDVGAPENEDTEFGEYLYNEASVPTRLEVLRLLSKDTPSTLVFMQAVSMGLGIDDVLDAAARYDPDKGRDFSYSARALLPLLSDSDIRPFSTYYLEDIDRPDETRPYSVQRVAERFFDDRQEILLPYADWPDGKYHFEASAGELLALSEANKEVRWYRNRSPEPVGGRPIFVSLYQSDKTILVDDRERIQREIDQNGEDARLPIVVIFNRSEERAVDNLEDYPLTIKGIQQAYVEHDWMVTPAPEWEKGEHHIYAQLEEFYEIFEIPTEQDFEPEHWQRLLEAARLYTGYAPSFLVVILSGDTDSDEVGLRSLHGQQFAANDDTRAEVAFPYTPANKNTSDNNKALDLESLVAQGLIMNRPDLIAALNALGVTEVPVAFYYLDDARTKPYANGPRGLRAIVIGAGTPVKNFGGAGGFGPPPVCASPPCNN